MISRFVFSFLFVTLSLFVSLFVFVSLSLFLPLSFFVQICFAEEARVLDAGQVRLIAEHKMNANAVSISPDGNFVVVGGAERFLILSELDTGKEIWRNQLRGVISALSFSPDGGLILVAGRDKNLIVCDGKTGKELSRFPQFVDIITAVEISPDGKYAAVGLENGNAGIFELNSKKLHKELKTHSRAINDITFSNNSDRVALASHDATVSIWSVDSGKLIYTFYGHRSSVKSVAFDHRDENIVSGSTDRSAYIWNPNANIAPKKPNQKTNQKPDKSTDKSTDKSAKNTPPKPSPPAAKDTKSVKDDKSKYQILQRLAGHKAEVSFVCFAPDSETVYTASIDKTIAQWNVKDGSQIVSTDTGQAITRASISPKTAYSFVTSNGKITAAVKTESLGFKPPKYPQPKARNPFPQLPKEEKPLMFLNANLSNDSSKSPDKPNLPKGNKCRFFVDSVLAVSVGGDGSGVVWNLVRGDVSYSFSHTSPLTAVAFSPLSSVIAIGSADKTIVLLQPKDGRHLATFKGHSGTITDLSFSKDGRRLFSASEDKSFITWNMETRQSDGVSVGHTDKITGIAVLPDMSKVISVSKDKTIRVWNSPSQHTIWNESIQEDKRAELVSLAIGTNGDWFAVGEESKNISIWKLSEKKCVATLSGLRDVPAALAVSPDGKYLLSGGVDGVVVVWNTSSWKAEKTFVQIPEQAQKNTENAANGWVKNLLQKVEYEPIKSISFNNDGSKIITSGGTKTFLWNGLK
ncbi:MAG: WD40 repeat domain-containing protein [Planctomycetaceae bacterium]|jgi:WD40 repeat protein|nr:WD40 repeat domain-containing protein [Planctomycetaceae bacterium]